MTIAICDDEKREREEMIGYCKRYASEFQVKYQIAEYTSGIEIMQSEPIDILLLDIAMKGSDGLQVKDFFQKQKRDTRILFVSGHDEAIPEAFGRQVYGFLCKPVSYEAFRQKMQVMMEDLMEQNKYILCENNGSVRKVFERQIQYIKAQGKYAELFLEGEESYLFSDKGIGVWKDLLETDGFVMCQRSYLVNCYYVEKIEKDVILKSGEHIPISRRMEKDLRDGYKDYIWRRAK